MDRGQAQAQPTSSGAHTPVAQTSNVQSSPATGPPPADALVRVADNALSGVEGAVMHAAGNVEGAYMRGAGRAESTVSQVEQSGVHALAQADHARAQVQDAAYAEVGSAYAQAQGVAARAATHVEDTYGRVVGTAEGTAARAVSQAEEVYAHTAGQVEGTYTLTTSQVEGALGQVESTATRALGQAEVVYTQAAGRVEGAYTQATGQVEGALGQVENTAARAVNQAEGAYNQVAGRVEDTYTRAVGQVGGAYTQAHDTVTRQVEGTYARAQDVYTHAQGAYNHILGDVHDVLGQAESRYAAAAGGIGLEDVVRVAFVAGAGAIAEEDREIGTEAEHGEQRVMEGAGMLEAAIGTAVDTAVGNAVNAVIGSFHRFTHHASAARTDAEHVVEDGRGTLTGQPAHTLEQQHAQQGQAHTFVQNLHLPHIPASLSRAAHHVGDAARSMAGVGAGAAAARPVDSAGHLQTQPQPQYVPSPTVAPTSMSPVTSLATVAPMMSPQNVNKSLPPNPPSSPNLDQAQAQGQYFPTQASMSRPSPSTSPSTSNVRPMRINLPPAAGPSMQQAFASANPNPNASRRTSSPANFSPVDGVYLVPGAGGGVPLGTPGSVNSQARPQTSISIVTPPVVEGRRGSYGMGAERPTSYPGPGTGNGILAGGGTGGMPGAWDAQQGQVQAGGTGVGAGMSRGMSMYAGNGTHANGSNGGFGAHANGGPSANANVNVNANGGVPTSPTMQMLQRPGRTVSGNYDRRASTMRSSVLDHNVPVLYEHGPGSDRSTANGDPSILHRLNPTLESAEQELAKYRLQARASGWALNVAIGCQVLLGALTTGVAAATTGRQTSIATTVLGGLSTLAASYIAKARGTNEPEASNQMVRELESFVRDCKACILDKGHYTGDKWDDIVNEYRDRLEAILGNRPKGLGERIKEKIGVHPHGGPPIGGHPTGGHPTGGHPTGGHPTGGFQHV